MNKKLDDKDLELLDAKKETFTALTVAKEIYQAFKSSEEAKAALQKQLDEQAEQIRSLQAESAAKEKRLTNLSTKNQNQALECASHKMALV